MRVKQLGFIFLSLSIFLAACSQEPISEEYIKAHLSGTWCMVTQNGIEQSTDALVFLSYDLSSMTETSTFLTDKITGKPEVAHNELSFSLNGNEIIMEDIDEEGKYNKKVYKIVSLDDHKYVIDVEQVFVEGVDIGISAREVYRKVEKDYSKALLGLWSGITSTNPIHGDENHRWEYLENGDYYYYEKIGNTWTSKPAHYNKYVVHGDWLVTCWQNIGEEAKAESWIIDYIKDGTMKWSRVSPTGDYSSYEFNKLAE